jgi:hypothetical protein
MKKLFLLSTAVLLIVVWPIYYFGGLGFLKVTLLSYVSSLAIVLFSYGSIRYTFSKSAKVFYTAIFVGMVLRFFVFLVVLYIVYKFSNLPILGFVVTFMLFYIIFQIQEVKFVVKELNQKRVALTDE